MTPNPLLNKLNLHEDGRAIIIYADDIGMCQSSLKAYEELLTVGLISSASTMVPCPWFPATAAFCRNQADSGLDMGVHITLNSEYLSYRWGPISTRDPQSGLLDQTEYFHTAAADTQANVDPAAVKIEIRAQVERALSAGIDVTHIDTHMGTVFHSNLLDSYLEVARETNILPFLIRRNGENRKQAEQSFDQGDYLAQKMIAMERQGFPMFDHIRLMPLDQHENRVETAIGIIESLPAGVTYFIIHPAKDTPELRAIAPDWKSRVADYKAFTSSQLEAYIKKTDISVINWQTLRGL